MEEKERYEYYPKQNQLYDKINDELYCLGIKQDKTRLVDFLNLMNEDWWTLYERNKELREENQQLKQQLHDLPKNIVEDCKMALIKRINIISGYGRMTIDEQSFFFENEYGKDLDTILKKYGGEND